MGYLALKSGKIGIKVVLRGNIIILSREQWGRDIEKKIVSTKTRGVTLERRSEIGEQFFECPTIVPEESTTDA
jgi:hypothetical protein